MLNVCYKDHYDHTLAFNRMFLNIFWKTKKISLFDVIASSITLYTVDATKFVTAQIDATFHEGRGKLRTVS